MASISTARVDEPFLLLLQVTYNQVQPFRISHPARQFVHIITPYDCIAAIKTQGFGKSLPI